MTNKCFSAHCTNDAMENGVLCVDHYEKLPAPMRGEQVPPTKSDTPLTDAAEAARENGGDITDIFTAMRQLERELNAALKDAARYRWLRSQAPMADITIECLNSSLAGGLCHLSEEDADSAIDAAMEQQS